MSTEMDKPRYAVELLHDEWCIIDQQPGVRVTLAVGCPIGRGGTETGRIYATHIVQKLNMVNECRAAIEAERIAIEQIARSIRADYPADVFPGEVGAAARHAANRILDAIRARAGEGE